MPSLREGRQAASSEKDELNKAFGRVSAASPTSTFAFCRDYICEALYFARTSSRTHNWIASRLMFSSLLVLGELNVEFVVAQIHNKTRSSPWLLSLLLFVSQLALVERRTRNRLAARAGTARDQHCIFKVSRLRCKQGLAGSGWRLRSCLCLWPCFVALVRARSLALVWRNRRSERARERQRRVIWRRTRIGLLGPASGDLHSETRNLLGLGVGSSALGESGTAQVLRLARARACRFLPECVCAEGAKRRTRRRKLTEATQK